MHCPPYILLISRLHFHSPQRAWTLIYFQCFSSPLISRSLKAISFRITVACCSAFARSLESHRRFHPAQWPCTKLKIEFIIMSLDGLPGLVGLAAWNELPTASTKPVSTSRTFGLTTKTNKQHWSVGFRNEFQNRSIISRMWHDSLFYREFLEA